MKHATQPLLSTHSSELDEQDDGWFSGKLIRWYAQNGRDLPWRQTTDPYKVWISEIILQQTRVDQGYNYFLRFVERFPDVHTLASAHEDEVMKYWQGLGYYSRARNLHTAAKSIDGAFPSTYETIRALKGVGEYTAAAVASIAFGLPYPVVDGNVYRVLSRFLGIDTPIDSTKGKKEIAHWAEQMMDAAHPADYNQAIMDFGAMLCTPKLPLCSTCPVGERCLALVQGQVHLLPVKQRKTKVTDRYFNYFYVHTSTHTFIYKRTGNDIWKNLYEFPLIETMQAVSMEELFKSKELVQMLSGNECTLIRPLQVEKKTCIISPYYSCLFL